MEPEVRDMIAGFGVCFLCSFVTCWAIYEKDRCHAVRSKITRNAVVIYPEATIASEDILPVAKEIDRNYLGAYEIENGQG